MKLLSCFFKICGKLQDNLAKLKAVMSIARRFTTRSQQVEILLQSKQEAQLVLGQPAVRWYFWDFLKFSAATLQLVRRDLESRTSLICGPQIVQSTRLVISINRYFGPLYASRHQMLLWRHQHIYSVQLPQTGWLSGRVSDLRSKGRRFEPRP